jgi:hypothetical protein
MLLRAATCVLTLTAALASTCIAAESTLEYQVKAAFLLNFTRFVEWSPSAFANAQAPFEICILGKDPFGHVLDDVVQGEVVNGRRIQIRRITEPPTAQTCQVLFVDPAVKEVRKILGGLAPTVLTVSESEPFISEGGMIALVVDNRRVRFDINQTAADNGALKLSSKLLSIARSVK